VTPGAPAAVRPLQDAQGRRITYLRLSLTDRCNLRCSYCAPAGGRAGGGTDGLLSRDEIRRLAGVLAGLGVRRVRLTGGEPTVRGDLLDVVSDLRALPGIEEVALTTNGHRLSELALPLRQAGVARLNVSLDTLDPERFRRIAGPGADLSRVLQGVAAASAARFSSLKLNAVVVRGENDGELAELARFAWGHGAIARFIELMPFGRGETVPVAEMRRLLERQGVRLVPDATRGWGPARHMRGAWGSGASAVRGLVGFIGALTEGFCDDCNRIRVGPDGALRACLGGREQVPLADLLRRGAADAEIAERVREALLAKRERHDMGTRPLPPMAGIGG
jgi:cyclic pyranopterin phosphate synthase